MDVNWQPNYDVTRRRTEHRTMTSSAYTTQYFDTNSAFTEVSILYCKYYCSFIYFKTIMYRTVCKYSQSCCSVKWRSIYFVAYLMMGSSDAAVASEEPIIKFTLVNIEIGLFCAL